MQVTHISESSPSLELITSSVPINSIANLVIGAWIEWKAFLKRTIQRRTEALIADRRRGKIVLAGVLATRYFESKVKELLFDTLTNERSLRRRAACKHVIKVRHRQDHFKIISWSHLCMFFFLSINFLLEMNWSKPAECLNRCNTWKHS